MIIFKSVENFFGFLFFAWVVINIVGVIAVMIVYRSDEPEEEKEEQPETVPEDVQAFIDGIENAIDNGWDFPPEDFEEYKRLTEDG